MIVELLRAEHILFDIKGSFLDALESLLRRFPFPERLPEVRQALSSGKTNAYSYIGSHVAIPHVRLDKITRPELILGLSREGVRLDSERVKIVLFFATPEEQTEEHLKLLQRLSSLLPATAADLLAQRDAAGVLRVVARGELLAGKATYLNLTEKQIAFELHTDLERGLSDAEAQRRRAHCGPNLLRKVPRQAWYLNRKDRRPDPGDSLRGKPVAKAVARRRARDRPAGRRLGIRLSLVGLVRRRSLLRRSLRVFHRAVRGERSRGVAADRDAFPGHGSDADGAEKRPGEESAFG